MLLSTATGYRHYLVGNAMSSVFGGAAQVHPGLTAFDPTLAFNA